MSIKKTFTLEALIYLLVIFIGFLLRILKLSNDPLSDYEALIALDGLNLISNLPGKVISDQTFLTNLLGSFFYLFGSGNLLSRLVPALAGTFLIIIPAFFRTHFDKKALLILSGWIAVSPTFVSLSRQVDSSMLLLVVFGLFVYFLLRKKSIASAVFLALALLTGRIFFWSLVLFFFVIVYTNLFGNKNETNVVKAIVTNIKELNIKTFSIAFLLSYIFLSTFGFIFSNQFTGAARGLIEFFNIFSMSTQVGSLGEISRSIIFYEPAVLLFGIIGLVWLFRRNQIAGLSITGIVIINIILLMAANERIITWNIFFVGPLMVSGSFFLGNFLKLPKDDLEKILYSTGIALSIVFFIGLAFTRMVVNQNQAIDQLNLRVLYIAAGVVLIFGAGLLAGWAISWRITGRSFLLLSVILFGIFTISATWNAAGMRKPVENEILRLDQVPIGNEMLVDITQDFSSWNYGVDNKANILILDNPSPSLQWSLRSFKNVLFQSTIPRDTVYDVVITSNNVLIEQTDTYRGQEVIWKKSPQWQNMRVNDFTNWILTRRVQENLLNKESLIIWIRNSLVPGMDNKS